MKRFFLLIVSVCMCLGVSAQMVPTTWTAYGLTFNATKGILVEEDTDDTFLLNNARFYITLHSLESDDMTQDAMKELLKGLADDDGIQEQSEILELDLKQFHVVYLKGNAEEDPCYYACLMTKEAGSVFYVSILYNGVDGKTVERMLKSFHMEE